MQRIERKLRETENMLVYLASHPKVPENVREGLLPVISAHLETINKWRMMKMQQQAAAADQK